MEYKEIYILCECGLSLLTVRKLEMIGSTLQGLIKDIDNLKILDGTTIQSKRKIRRALIMSQKLKQKYSLYQLAEYGLSESLIKRLLSKISTFEEFDKLTENKLNKYFNNKAITNKIIKAQELYKKNEKIDLDKVEIKKKETDEYLKIECYYSQMPEGRIKEILGRAWNGENIAKLAEYYKYSRYGLQLLIQRESKKIITFEDKQYAYIFKKYNWKPKEFCEIFKEDNMTYYYLKYKYKKYKTICNTYVELLQNENIDDKLKEKLKHIN